MANIEKLMNLLEKKYGNKNITDGSKEKIRTIVREEIARVVESLEEVNDSESLMIPKKQVLMIELNETKSFGRKSNVDLYLK